MISVRLHGEHCALQLAALRIEDFSEFPFHLFIDLVFSSILNDENQMDVELMDAAGAADWKRRLHGRQNTGALVSAG